MQKGLLPVAVVMLLARGAGALSAGMIRARPAVRALRGGAAALTSSASVEEAAAPQEKFRLDYQPPPFRIDAISMDFDIHDAETVVTSRLTVIPSADAAEGATMFLDGEDLTLKAIEINGSPIDEGADYELSAEGMTLLRPPAGDAPFEVKTVVSIDPVANTQLSGLYKSGAMYCTQCEAEGFRRITYFQDRPDVMARYDVRIEADKSKYPLLLSNGNEAAKGDAAGGRHWASFSDPLRKPSYLFAAVAGDLGGIEDIFTTMSGRQVRLAVWSEHENVDQLDWSMESLKHSMRWDEETYGREYDLDVFHIVAVNDFNMGAMENKGLNIFNTAAVLAKPSTATDADYERVQGIVAHEYFHNWSGNRVTCRDWFQLTLKEGLTVFRDQHFSQEMTSAAVKRIEEARIIRSAQFVQDAGPMAHPIRPESYIAMDNFYTVTCVGRSGGVRPRVVPHVTSHQPSPLGVTRRPGLSPCPASSSHHTSPDRDALPQGLQQGCRSHPDVSDAPRLGGLPQGHGPVL
jgi:aminopeptidase N